MAGINLAQKKCVPCEGGTPPLKREEAERLLPQVPGWELSANAGKISRLFIFKDFKEAMRFVNKTAEIAETEGHHPSIEIVWNKVTLTLWTHAISGLSENDFILAAKTNTLN